MSSLSGLVGLSLSYALSITMLLSGLIFSFTQTEMQLVSVERTEEYSTGLPVEPQDQNTQVRPAAALPQTDTDRSTTAVKQMENMNCLERWFPTVLVSRGQLKLNKIGSIEARKCSS